MRNARRSLMPIHTMVGVTTSKPVDFAYRTVLWENIYEGCAEQTRN